LTEDSLNILAELGWDVYFQQHFDSQNIPGAVPARVFSEQRGMYQVLTGQGPLQAEISGKFRNQAEVSARFPAVGDWVAAVPLPGEPKAVIQALLPERSRFSRQAAGGRERLSGGKTQEQIVAANVDTVFIVGAMDGGRSSNMRRIERYLTLAWNSGATPVVLLNKADLCPDVADFLHSLETVTTGVAVHAVSAVAGTGLKALSPYLSHGKTVAFLGSSGVGKSALINALLGFERQEVGDVRDRDRTGRHTTTTRELILLPGGGAVIDTPGMREIQMWAGEDDLDNTFEDIAALARECRFKDCRHNAEPGCAVKEAITRGKLDIKRFEYYQKLQKEIHYHEAREAGSVRLEEKLRWKKISKIQKSLKKGRS
jgi:ribosome biogenesis GTPase / thiamine phosphate phosphatase